MTPLWDGMIWDEKSGLLAVRGDGGFDLLGRNHRLLAADEAARALAAIHVVEEQGVEDLVRRTARAGQVAYLRVVDRELGDLARQIPFDVEALVPPEGGVAREQKRQAHQEGEAQVRRALFEGDDPDAPGLVDQVEEGPDVLAQDVAPDAVVDHFDATTEFPPAVAETGTDMRVQGADDLGEGHGADQLLARLALAPGYAVDEHEVRVEERQVVDRLDGWDVRPHVAQEDVRVDLGPVGVEDAEALALPLLVGVEVHRGSKPGFGVLVAAHHLAGRGYPLEPVDDVDVVRQDEDARLALAEVPSPGPEIDVGNGVALDHRVDNLVDGLNGENLALVLGLLEQTEGVRIDHPA